MRETQRLWEESNDYHQVITDTSEEDEDEEEVSDELK